MKRKIDIQLKEWKTHKGKECLLVNGARQIGKTYSISEFGRAEYKSFISINFEEKPQLKAVFTGELSVAEIKKRLSIQLPGITFIPHDTLLFLDEIQACPEARTAEKFLALEADFDVIASGSLLGIHYKDVPSFPVGYEKQIEMLPLDFEEYLWAIGISTEAIAYVKSFFDERKKIPEETNQKMMEYLREYMVVGGMPEVVSTFIATNNYNEVQNVQNKIISSYIDDTKKYASEVEQPKVCSCFFSIPQQLAKENKKFQFSLVEKKSTARKYGNSLEWLRDANIVSFCYDVSTPEFPLAAYARENQFKLYMTDIGLLVSLYGFEMKKALIEDTLTGPAKGGVYENLIASMLRANGHKLYYYKADDNTQEIEFIITKESSVIPIEVKSKNGATVSLNEMLKRDSILYGYKLINGNIGVDGKKVSLPLYMALFL